MVAVGGEAKRAVVAGPIDWSLLCSPREQNMSCICTLVHVLAIRLFQWSGSATLAGGH